MANIKVVLVMILTLILLGHSLAEPEAKEKSQKDEVQEKVSPEKESLGTISDLFVEVGTPGKETSNKVTIVGTGRVGTATAFSLITQYVTDEVVMIGKDINKVNGEVEDLIHGSGFIRGPNITGSIDYKDSKNSKICIVTAGVAQKPGQDRISLLQENYAIFKTIIPKLLEHNPDAVIIIVTNPVDIMTYITWKVAKDMKLQTENPFRIIGAGTNLDSARLRFLIAQELKISPESVNGWVVGEHGDSSVTVWSDVNVGGVNLRNTPQLIEQLAKHVKEGGKIEDWFANIHEQMQKSAGQVIHKKGYTSWAVGLSVANLAHSIIHNTHKIHAVSTMVKGLHGIKDDVFLSLPCALGEDGVTRIIQQPLEADELASLKKSAALMHKTITEFEKSLKPKQ